MLKHSFALTSSLGTALLLAGCTVISTVPVTGGQLTVFRAGADAQPAAQTPVALSAAQRQFIEEWLAARRSGWSARYAPTLIPAWCLRLDAPQDKTVSLCRYGATVVLRGVGPEVERKLTSDDEAQFARALEGIRG